MNLNLRATGPLRMLGVRLPEDEWLGELAPVQGKHAGHARQSGMAATKKRDVYHQAAQSAPSLPAVLFGIYANH